MSANLDSLVIFAISDGKKHFAQLMQQFPRHSARQMDRRLQQLKKAGKIKYQGQKEGWVVL